MTSLWQNTCAKKTAGVFCLLTSFFRNEPQKIVMGTIRPAAIIALCYPSIVSTLNIFIAFVWLIKVRPPAIISTRSYVHPLVAVLPGWAFAGESISFVQVIALLIILSGVLLVNIAGYKQSML